MKNQDTVIQVGINDPLLRLFEGQYETEHGMSFNSYIIFDEKTAVLDTVDAAYQKEWLKQVQEQLAERKPDYLIIHHMEPDHSACIQAFLELYPDTVVVGNAKTFQMMEAFFDAEIAPRRKVVQDQERLSLGRHELQFLFAPMVHWPEVMMSYEVSEQILFSADAFGRFGTQSAAVEWSEEARRYYYGIVGKFGIPVQNCLKKAGVFPIRKICPLHGPILEDCAAAIEQVDRWSRYQAETSGVLIAFSSVYGHTKQAALKLAELLKEKSIPTECIDLNQTDVSWAVAKAFQYSHLVLASVTYNGDVFPSMRNFLLHLKDRNFQRRTLAAIESGTWAPTSETRMRSLMAECAGVTWPFAKVQLLGSMKAKQIEELARLAEQLSASVKQEA